MEGEGREGEGMKGEEREGRRGKEGRGEERRASREGRRGKASSRWERMVKECLCSFLPWIFCFEKPPFKLYYPQEATKNASE